MGWALAAELTQAPPDRSITVAVISACGVVLVALIGLAGHWMTRSSRTPDVSQAADPKLGERVVRTETLVQEDRRTLAQLDRYVDGIGDQVDRQGWRLDDLIARFEDHMHRYHGGPR